jgi:SAM-dependent methyltransferase
MSYAGEDYWDRYFDTYARPVRPRLGGEWTRPFLPLLLAAGVQRVLDLGCGIGHDAARLAEAGLSVVGLLLPPGDRTGAGAVWDRGGIRCRDMAERLPFGDGAFDAVMANVALHMFPDATTRSIFTEAGRVLGSWVSFCSTSTRTTIGLCARVAAKSLARSSPGTSSSGAGRRCASSRASISRAPARMGVGRARSHRAARPRNAPAVQARLAGRCPPSRLSRGNRRGTL